MEATRSQPVRRSLISRFVDFVWSCIKWCVLLALIVAVAGGYYYYRGLNDDIRAHAESLLAEAYPNYEVKVGSAQLVEGEGILIHSVTVTDPAESAPWNELVHIEELMVTCPTQANKYLSGEFAVEHLELRRPVLRCTRREDGSWNTTDLLPLPRLSNNQKPAPQATIEGGTLEILDETNSPASAITLRDVHLTLTPIDQQPGEPAKRLTVEGWASSDHFQRVDLNGRIDTSEPGCSLRGTIAAVQLTPVLWDAMPSEFASLAKALSGLEGRSHVQFSLERAQGAEAPLLFSVTGNLEQGRWRDPRFTYPLNDLEATFTADNQGLRIERLTGRSRQATLELSLASEGFAADSPWQLEAHVRQLALDGDLLAALPEHMRETWAKLSPAGSVHADLSLRYDGNEYHPNLRIQCLGTSFAYHEFPYRFQGTTGELHLVDQHLDANLVAHAGQTPIHITGSLENPSNGATGAVSMVSDGPVVVDDSIIDVLKPNGQRFLRLLRPQGMVRVNYQMKYRGNEGLPPQHNLVLNVENSMFNHMSFPYPIDRVSGVIEMHDGRWTFHDFEGRNDSAVLNWSGEWQAEPGSEEGTMHIDLVITDLPLEDELRDALSPRVAGVWTDLRPRGTIDHVRMAIDYHLPEQRLAIEVRAQKWARPQAGELGNISIEPVWLPYRVDNLTGTLTYRDGRLEMEDIRGRHGSVAITAAGLWQSNADGAWRVRLEPLTVDCLQFDRETLTALPPQLAAAVDKVSLAGPMNLSGAIEWSRSSHTAPVQTSWQVRMDMSDASLNVGLPLSHIYGGATLAGAYQEEQFQCRGELEIDSAMYNEIQLTHIAGPFCFDPTQVVLGAWAVGPETGQQPRPVTAGLLGGAAAINAQIVTSDPGQYSLQASLTNASFAEIVRDAAQQGRNVNGRVSGTLNLQGTREGVYTQRGNGRIELREADLYELPLALALLNIVTAQAPDRTAFHGSDIDYRIEGEHIYLDHIDLLGSGFALKGNGEMNRQHEMNLTFFTRIGPNLDLPLPLVKPLYRAASRQILLIRATGTLENPVVERQVLPTVTDTLRRLFPSEFADREAEPGGVLPR